MFRRFSKIILVAVVLILAFVGILSLFTTAGDVPTTPYVEHTYKAVRAGQQFSDNNEVTARHIPVDGNDYRQKSLGEEIQTVKPSIRQISFQYDYPRGELRPFHYSPDSAERGVRDDLGDAINLLYEWHSSEKAQDAHENRQQTDQTAGVFHSDKIAQTHPVDAGKMMASDARFARVRNDSTQMEGLALAHLGKQTEKAAFPDIQKQRAANRARQRSVHVESLDALKKQHAHYSVWDDSNTSDLGFWDVLNKSYVDQHMPRPWIGSYQCRDVICSEFLYKRDWVRVGKCANKLNKKDPEEIKKIRSTLRPACHFINGTSRGGSVALLSFPGSGNTWLRGLLEKATGICTGSVYCDESIWFAGSVGEGIKSSNVLVVKSHNHDRDWTKQSTNDSDWNQAAVLIIRNPFDAIVSFYKWSIFHFGFLSAGNNSHVSEISLNLFRNHPLWKNYVADKRNRWSNIIRGVVLENSSGRPVLVVRYEDVKRNRTKEVMRILDFLGVSYSPQEVKQKLQEDVTTFQRKKQVVRIDPYTPEQRGLIREVLQHMAARLQQENDGDLLGIEEYLKSH